MIKSFQLSYKWARNEPPGPPFTLLNWLTCERVNLCTRTHTSCHKKNKKNTHTLAPAEEQREKGNGPQRSLTNVAESCSHSVSHRAARSLSTTAAGPLEQPYIKKKLDHTLKSLALVPDAPICGITHPPCTRKTSFSLTHCVYCVESMTNACWSKRDTRTHCKLSRFQYVSEIWQTYKTDMQKNASYVFITYLPKLMVQ